MNRVKRIAEILRDTWDEELEGEKLLSCIGFELMHCLGHKVNFERDQDLIADIIKEYKEIKNGSAS